MNRQKHRSSNIWILGMALGIAAISATDCASRPSATPGEAEPAVRIPAEPRISLKPVHRSMREGMRISYEAADEILIGVYTGITQDGPQGRVHYFDRFRSFDKTTWTWGPETDALLAVLFEGLVPEILSEREFKALSALDRLGICWDDFEGPRVVYLAEGVPTLVFLKHIIDAAGGTSRRILLDTYPETRDCRAKDVFHLMLRDIAGRTGTR
jgi:hypothetical protein